MNQELKFDVDYMGEMTMKEISTPGSGFNRFQVETIKLLDVNAVAELISSDMAFKVRRIQ